MTAFVREVKMEIVLIFDQPFSLDQISVLIKTAEAHDIGIGGGDNEYVASGTVLNLGKLFYSLGRCKDDMPVLEIKDIRDVFANELQPR